MRRRKPPKLRANGSAGDGVPVDVERAELRTESTVSAAGAAPSGPAFVCGPFAVGGVLVTGWGGYGYDTVSCARNSNSKTF